MDRDLNPDELRQVGQELISWIADYLERIEDHRVTPVVGPGDLTARLSSPPDNDAGATPPAQLLAEFESEILPHVVHWKHPGFMAYFAAGGSAHGVLVESLIAALNNVGLLWRASPALAELEQVSLRLLASWLDLPEAWFGVTHTTASEASLHAVIAAREQARARLGSRFDLNRLVMYTSEHAHSSIEKSMIALGHGREACRKISTDADFQMRPDALRAAIQSDLDAGLTPIAVAATIGTTSTSSIDPVPAIADVAAEYDLWLHVDAAYAGPCAMIPEMRDRFLGVDRADSFLLNPHKWMFSPMGLSALYTAKPETFRSALSLTPEYLRSGEDPAAVNFMEYSIPLGRPFRGLKLWWLMRSFGRDGYTALLRKHCALAAELAQNIDGHPDFERLAPTPFSLVCFRAAPQGVPSDDLDALNQRLLEAVNDSGEFFLSHTKLNGRFTIRVAIGNVTTERRHVQRLWDLLQKGIVDLARSSD